MHLRFTAILLTVFLLSGCVATNTLTPFEFKPAVDLPKFVPVTLFVNRAEPVPRFYMSRVYAVEREMGEGKIFTSIGSDVESPYVLDAKMHRGSNESSINFVGHILSAATLFLIPSKISNYNELTVDLYVNGARVESFRYREDYEDTSWLFNAPGDVEFQSIRSLVNKFLQEFESKNLIPRAEK